MSTSINDPMIPDARMLEQLANAMFKNESGAGMPIDNLPAVSPAQVQTASAPANYQPAEHNGVNVRQPQTSLHDPHFGNSNPVPASVAGSGVSPDGRQINQFGATLPQTLPDTKTTTHGVVPGSVAGSGISPSVTDHGKRFNINDPQTSHVDPHLGTPGVVPSSLGGRGISEGSPFFGQSGELPPGATTIHIRLQTLRVSHSVYRPLRLPRCLDWE
jgi:hypothetical protein